MKSLKWFIFIFVITFIIFYPSLKVFYTNDDFFHLEISKATNISEFIGFFNLFSPASSNASYRPISTQAFFFLSKKVFDLNPFGMHLTLLLVYFIIIYLVYLLSKKIFESKKAAFISTGLYAVSSTHFGQLFFISSQELWLALFTFLSILFFIKLFEKIVLQDYFLSILFFIFALMSKESSVILPVLLIIVFIYFKYLNQTKLTVKRFIILLIPYVFILAVYLFCHVFVYGMQKGESYVWDFSPRLINTLIWYGLWSFNIPEMLVDFIGPGLRINISQLLYWKNYLLIILITSLSFLAFIVFKFVSVIKNAKKQDFLLYFFAFFWFLLTLLPVLFLPWHKFVYYLTLPLFGVVLTLTHIIFKAKIKPLTLIIIFAFWLTASFTNISLSRKTSWITQGAVIAEKIYRYLGSNYENLANGQAILFYDTPSDKYLPWSPAEEIKTVLSNDNFFQVFYPKLTVYYGETKVKNPVKIPARQFLGY